MGMHVYQVKTTGTKTNKADRVVRLFANKDLAERYAEDRRMALPEDGAVTVKRLHVSD